MGIGSGENDVISYILSSRVKVMAASVEFLVRSPLTDCYVTEPSCVREQQERSLSFGVGRVCVAACQGPHQSVGGLLLV